LITLTSDFGYNDPFVGMMKGVILRINPRAAIADLTHGITPHDVREAAMAIGESHVYFPPGTVHVVVVDPGVGSGRRRMLLEAAGQFFVGPDNGVFTTVIARHKEDAPVRSITASHLFLKSPGRTFEGRDVFAPVAAWLSMGTPPGELGEPVSDYVMLSIPAPRTVEDRIEGEVVRIDRFGNAITNISGEDINAFQGGGRALETRIKGRVADMFQYYSEPGAGAPGVGAIINSSGHLEIFMFMGSAAGELGLKPGEPVVITSK
jgi:S-adenosylmethionine hydrolase